MIGAFGGATSVPAEVPGSVSHWAPDGVELIGVGSGSLRIPCFRRPLSKLADDRIDWAPTALSHGLGARSQVGFGG